MNKVKLIKILPLLPLAWLDCLRVKNQPYEIRIQKARVWSRKVLKQAGLTLKVTGRENLQDNQKLYFICNHQGTLDPAVLLCALPVNIRFISKKENESIPVLGKWAKAVNTIHFDRNSRKDNIHMFRLAIKSLKNKENLLIFPEGTRSKKDKMNLFHEQAIQPGVKAKASIVPVTLNKAYALDVKDTVKEISVHIGKPVHYEQYATMNDKELSGYLFQKISSHIQY